MPKVVNKRTATADELNNGVYIGRPTMWGNPFSTGSYGREGAIRKYREYLFANPDLLAAAQKELRGKDLICWCAPRPCHGDILLDVANL